MVLKINSSPTFKFSRYVLFNFFDPDLLLDYAEKTWFLENYHLLITPQSFYIFFIREQYLQLLIL